MTSRAPLATYRLQLNSNFCFEDAIAVLDYLRDLGISHVYASPVLTSRKGSGHGYDVTDPTKIDPDLGGEEGFAALQKAVEERGMGLLLDIVPNHMAASSENRWWMDVLEYGPESPFAPYFDINWHPASPTLDNKILLPFLDRPFGEVLDSGGFRLSCVEGKFVLNCGEQLFPIAPSSYAEILRNRNGHGHTLDPDSPAGQEWEGILAAADSVAGEINTGLQAASERRIRFERMRDRLRQPVASSPEIAALVESNLVAMNGRVGEPGTLRALEQVLAKQHYRLAFWQTASDSINYRRFFSITDLVGVRVEDPAVFDATHEPMVRLASKPDVPGLRVDHIDGLIDPFGYLTRLRERTSANGSGPYIVVEKILEREEFLPADWPVQGTTGYDYLNFSNRLMVDECRAPALQDVYARWTNSTADFDEILYQKKKLVMRTLLAVEMRALGRRLVEVSRDDRYARELPPTELIEALVEVTACLSIYRTYLRSLDVPAESQGVVARAIFEARRRRPALPAACFDFLSDVLLLASPDHVRASQRELRLAFVSRWQQITGPIVAKGLEDTALYVYFPLASLNEVGGDPRVSAADPLAFHRFIARRKELWPDSMNATTTHDTKRSEDVRARIAVLSEIPSEWEAGLQRWSQMNAKHAAQVNGVSVPDRNEEYLLYQTLAGSWPLAADPWDSFVPRLQEYFVKATREAMLRTRWTRPNEAHEGALKNFIASVVDKSGNAEFCADFQEFQKHIALYGMVNGLAQVLLKISSPGVPDFYQGAELWDLRLVDPDNRGPVDFAARRALLGQLPSADAQPRKDQIRDWLAHWHDGRIKMHVIQAALRARSAHSELFARGEYIPLEIAGARRQNALAFARHYQDQWAVAVVPRCLASGTASTSSGDAGFWGETSIELPGEAPPQWTNALAGADDSAVCRRGSGLAVADILEDFPVALLLPAVQ
jgi:(1->4)-alpha-D-glucan 1-alpha-D-glucosylmutase